jgi:hypothetical protein
MDVFSCFVSEAVEAWRQFKIKIGSFLVVVVDPTPLFHPMLGDVERRNVLGYIILITR